MAQQQQAAAAVAAAAAEHAQLSGGMATAGPDATSYAAAAMAAAQAHAAQVAAQVSFYHGYSGLLGGIHCICAIFINVFCSLSSIGTCRSSCAEKSGWRKL